jgi:hypothetical protein
MARAVTIEELTPGRTYEIVILHIKNMNYPIEVNDQVHERPYNMEHWRPIYRMEGEFIESRPASELTPNEKGYLWNRHKLPYVTNPLVAQFGNIRNGRGRHHLFLHYTFFCDYGPSDDYGVQFYEPLSGEKLPFKASRSIKKTISTRSVKFRNTPKYIHVPFKRQSRIHVGRNAKTRRVAKR